MSPLLAVIPVSMWIAIGGLLLTILGAVLGIVRKVEHLSTQINNGLADRTQRIERQVDRLVERLLDESWDGNDRRK